MVKPTEPQIKYLKSFGITDAEIDKMDFQKASDKLNDLITRAKQRSPNYTSSTSPKVAGEPQARGNEPANASDFKRLTDTIKEFYGDASSNTKKEEDSIMKDWSSSPEPPLPLTDKQINSFIVIAQTKVAMAFDDKSQLSQDNQLVAMVFKALIDKQAQEFWLTMTKYEYTLKRKNIERVKQ